MDTNKQNEKRNEAEQPPQPEVADLSTAVEPMNAKYGLDLDSYSPVSNSNTEEMEGFLRVEDEILYTSEEQTSEAVSNKMVGLSTSAKAAKTERPATNALQVARMRVLSMVGFPPSLAKALGVPKRKLSC
ncbi:hypothetical protein ACLKA6_016237 [Drosophila palustris]